MNPFVKPKNLVPFAPSPAKDQDRESELDRTGRRILTMLQEAAKVSSDACQRAVEEAHRLSDELIVVENREKELQAELRHYQDRATRAEAWLLRIYKEAEANFFKQNTPAAMKNSPRAAQP